MDLKTFFSTRPKIALAFSGGCDSTFLLLSALQNGVSVRAYYVKTPFQTEKETAFAISVASSLGAEIRILDADPLRVEEIVSNRPDRCYFCKRLLFGTILREAEKDGFPLLCDGTNASDDESDRPGMRALREFGVLSPLRTCGLTKHTIRMLSREAGLPTASLPSGSCLATRIRTGERITPEKLQTTEKSENFLFSLGFSGFRVRFLSGIAKIEIRKEQIPLLCEKREEILKELKKHYSAVWLDLEARE